MKYLKALKRKEKLEEELSGLKWKVENAGRLIESSQIYYDKKEKEYFEFLKEEKL